MQTEIEALRLREGDILVAVVGRNMPDERMRQLATGALDDDALARVGLRRM